MCTVKSPKVVIVGAGISGLTAAAYLTRAKLDVLVIDKNNECGGLLNSFERDGFLFDAGARSIENSGIVRPMLKDLGINLEMDKSRVSIGIEDRVIHFESLENMRAYRELLEALFPESKSDIAKILKQTAKILKGMTILYGIDNPLFRDLKHDRQFLFKVLMPWFGKFLATVYRMNRTIEPVEHYLAKLTTNTSLRDIIDQHFFKNTPTFFALGYFYVYLDYLYPKGGTGQIPKALQHKILDNGGKILLETEIIRVNPIAHQLLDTKGKIHTYDYLIWAADLKTFYRYLTTTQLPPTIVQMIDTLQQAFAKQRGCDSVFSLFLGVDEPPATFKAICNGHFFYTPSRTGLGETHLSELKTLIANFESTPKTKIYNWIEKYCQLNTYEIGIPALRDPRLAPPGKTGLNVSFLFEYDLVKKVKEAGWYDEFKTKVESTIIESLSNSIFPFLKQKTYLRFSSTPITIAQMFGTSEGAITGWSYEYPVPVVNKLLQIGGAVKTPLSEIFQAGQWAYCPAGIPTSILTGWYAAQAIINKGSK